MNLIPKHSLKWNLRGLIQAVSLISDNNRGYLLKQLDWKWCTKATNVFQTIENVYISFTTSWVAVDSKKLPLHFNCLPIVQTYVGTMSGEILIESWYSGTNGRTIEQKHFTQSETRWPGPAISYCGWLLLNSLSVTKYNRKPTIYVISCLYFVERVSVWPIHIGICQNFVLLDLSNEGNPSVNALICFKLCPSEQYAICWNNFLENTSK